MRREKSSPPPKSSIALEYARRPGRITAAWRFTRCLRPPLACNHPADYCTLHIVHYSLNIQGTLIARKQLIRRISRGLKASPAVALLGPRQCGKTTIARLIAAGERSTYFDLESPLDLARLSQPMMALEPLRGLVV